jgi:hypothetical protein
MVMSRGTCKTCKYWSCFGEEEYKDFGKCESPKVISVSLFDNRKEIHVPDVFTYIGKYMSCGENFGCIHHEQKSE